LVPTGRSGGPANLFLDHSGATLYDGDYHGYLDGQNGYQAFSVDSSSGSLNYLGITPQGWMIGDVLSFLGNNSYAYSADCYKPGSSSFSPTIYGYRRLPSGTLSPLNGSFPIPSAPSGERYCPLLVAADPTNHLAVAMTPSSSSQYTVAGPPQLAVYTADSSGNLTTTCRRSG
jgi:hypothetical protein